MTLSKTYYSPLIAEAASKHGIDPLLVEAVVLQESSGFADAFRFEPKFHARYLAKLPRWNGANPRRISSSYGLMQVMYIVAWELGFLGEPEELFVPKVNLEWGCLKLRSLVEWANTYCTTHPDIHPTSPLTLNIAAAYNGGRADNEPGHLPMLRNESYSRAVLRRMEALK